jgi:hypothetical protein
VFFINDVRAYYDHDNQCNDGDNEPDVFDANARGEMFDDLHFLLDLRGARAAPAIGLVFFVKTLDVVVRTTGDAPNGVDGIVQIVDPFEERLLGIQRLDQILAVEMFVVVRPAMLTWQNVAEAIEKRVIAVKICVGVV